MAGSIAVRQDLAEPLVTVGSIPGQEGMDQTAHPSRSKGNPLASRGGGYMRTRRNLLFGLNLLVKWK